MTDLRLSEIARTGIATPAETRRLAELALEGRRLEGVVRILRADVEVGRMHEGRARRCGSELTRCRGSLESARAQREIAQDELNELRERARRFEREKGESS